MYSSQVILKSVGRTLNKKVTSHFLKSGLKPSSIIKIERICNEKLQENFADRKRKRTFFHGKDVPTDMLFHGTLQENVGSIYMNGFMMQRAGVHGETHGRGLYFAVDSNLAHKHTGKGIVRSMFVAEIITGRFDVWKNVCDGKRIGSVNCPYDSGVDNLKNPKTFITCHDSCACPRYLITYTMDEEEAINIQ